MSMSPRPLQASLLVSLLLAGCAAQPGKPSSAPAPGGTGITRCDDYLASYRACHRAAGIFAADEIESHYQAMRRSLLEESRDPAVRPQLSARCELLTRTLREALHDRPCDTPAAPTDDSTHR